MAIPFGEDFRVVVLPSEVGAYKDPRSADDVLGFKPLGDNLHQRGCLRRIVRPYMGTRSIYDQVFALGVQQLYTKHIIPSNTSPESPDVSWGRPAKVNTGQCGELKPAHHLK